MRNKFKLRSLTHIKQTLRTTKSVKYDFSCSDFHSGINIHTNASSLSFGYTRYLIRLICVYIFKLKETIFPGYESQLGYIHPQQTRQWPVKNGEAGRMIATHSNDVTMGAIASQIASLTIVYSIVYSDADQRKHQSSASLAFVRGIHRGPVNSPHKWPVTRNMFPFDDVIMRVCYVCCQPWLLWHLN